MKPYEKPELRDLGRMSAVTQKSGVFDDVGGEPSEGNTFFGWLCQLFPDLCSGQFGNGGGTQGTGSF